MASGVTITPSTMSTGVLAKPSYTSVTLAVKPQGVSRRPCGGFGKSGVAFVFSSSARKSSSDGVSMSSASLDNGEVGSGSAVVAGWTSATNERRNEGRPAPAWGAGALLVSSFFRSGRASSDGGGVGDWPAGYQRSGGRPGPDLSRTQTTLPLPCSVTS